VALKWRDRITRPSDIKVVAPKSKFESGSARTSWPARGPASWLASRPFAAMMLTEWEIGQRLTDVRMFRWGGEYKPAEGFQVLAGEDR
jgi:hypothetical protein